MKTKKFTIKDMEKAFFAGQKQNEFESWMNDNYSESKMTRDDKIQIIREIIMDWGCFGVVDVNGNSPLLNTMGKDNYELVEYFNLDSVNTFCYVHDTQTEENDMPYDDLPDDVIDDIYVLANDYKDICENTFDKCRDENY